MGITDIPNQTERATPTLQAPCPACGTPFDWPPTGRCARCQADLAGPTAAAIFDLDRDAEQIRRRREQQVDALRVEAGARAPQGMPAPTAPGARPRRRTSRLRPQTLLAAAGAVLLLAAVIVFIAVTWPTWPASAQVAFVLVLTVVGAFTARAIARRDLPATADALGVLTLAVASYSLLAAHAEGLAGLDAVATTLWVALVAAVASIAARPFAIWAGLRDTPRRLAALAAVVAGGSLLLWLDEAVATTPPLPVLAAAPTVAALLLLHGRWVLRAGDVTRHLVRVMPALLLVTAAAVTGMLDLTMASVVAVVLAAVIGLPLLVGVRRAAPSSPWTYGAAMVATVWLVQLVTFGVSDVTFGALGFAVPRLVTFSVVTAAVAVGARWRTPPLPWRQPVLAATSLAGLPAAAWTLLTWATAAAVVVEALEQPFTGWPGADPLTRTHLVLATAALLIGAVVVERLRTSATVPLLLAAGGATVLAATIGAAAGGLLPVAAPTLLLVVAAAAAAWWWHRKPTWWAPVAAAHVAVLVVAAVDLDVFAVAAVLVALHLLWSAARTAQPITAAAGVAAGLAAVAASSQTLDWSTPTTTLLVTVVAGACMAWAQLATAGRTWRHTATDVVVLLAALAATAVAAEAGAATTVAVQFTVIAVVALLHAARPGRGVAVWLASASATAAIWTLLGDRAVEVVEAYTVPAAVTLALAGAWRLHATETSSWAALWPACSMASLPTLVVLLDGPDTRRVLLLATAAVMAALAGHWRRLAAPLAVGTVVAMATAVLQLHYWTLHLPRWVTFGALGLVLILTSATYETQLRRARAIGQHLRQLR